MVCNTVDNYANHIWFNIKQQWFNIKQQIMKEISRDIACIFEIGDTIYLYIAANKVL